MAGGNETPHFLQRTSWPTALMKYDIQNVHLIWFNLDIKRAQKFFEQLHTYIDLNLCVICQVSITEETMNNAWLLIFVNCHMKSGSPIPWTLTWPKELLPRAVHRNWIKNHSSCSNSFFACPHFVAIHFYFYFFAVFCLWCYFGIYSFVEFQFVPVKCKHKHMTTYVQNRCGFCKNSNINRVDEKQVRGSLQYYEAGTNWLYRTQIKKLCHEKKNDCSTSIHNHISVNPPLSANQTQSLNCCFSLSAFGDQHWEDPSKDFDKMWCSFWQMWTLSPLAQGVAVPNRHLFLAIPFFCCPVATIQFYAISVQFQRLLLCETCLACQQPVKTKPVRAIANT